MLRMSTRPSQAVLDLTPEHTDLAHLWLPEIVEIGDRGEMFPFADNRDHPIVWNQDSEAVLSYDLNLPDLLALSVRIRAETSGFALEMEIGNLTAEDWREVQACVCLQLTLAVSFLDLGWERTFCVMENDLVRLSEIEKVGKGKPWFLFAMLPGHQAPLRHRDPHRENAKWLFSETSPDCGFICVTAVDGSRTVWMGWEEVQYLQSNVMPSYGCIHANPFFGDIGAGARARRRGRVGVVEGGAESARDAYMKEFAA